MYMKNLFAIIAFVILALFLSCNEEQLVYPPVLGDGIAEVTSSEIVLKSSFNTSDFEIVSECGFVIGKDTIFNEYTKVMSKKVSNNFSCTLENIDSGKYYAKSYARNRIGTGYGKLFSFEVLTNNDTVSSGNLPTVQTFDATNIGSSNATLNGYVWSAGDNSITATGFVYGTNASNLTQNVQSGSGTGNISETITGLTANTTYYYKAYATNSACTAYGEVKQFTTENSSTTGTLNGHEWVDLGLPSGTRWATCNVGASTPTANGKYYAWGETFTKSEYVESNYTYSDNPTILPSSADAATANWGVGWRMPTYDEQNELKNNCTVTWTTQNGVNGRLFTGPNGNSIFLPPAGYRVGSGFYYYGSGGYVWSSSLGSDDTVRARYLSFHSDGWYGSIYRYYGLTVRAVCNPR